MTNKQKTSKTMNIILWTAQILLAISLIWAAAMKLFQSPEKLAEMWPWTADNIKLVKFTATLDLLAGLGLILPAFFQIPKMTVYAAYGIILLMIAASIFHITRGEASLIGINIFFAFLAAFIAWGRQKKAPLSKESHSQQ